MQRIGIITFLHNDNYGSTLQAWALQKAVASLGYQAEHMDYKPNRTEKLANLLRSGNSPRLLLEGLRKRAVKATNSGARSKSASFAPFYQQHMALSPVCASHAALKRQARHYSLLLSGSDQIWSPLWLNPAYFLDFAGSTPRVAYAASLGVSQISSKRKIRRMAGLVRSYKAVSLREQEGAQLLAPMLGYQPEVMPDPVCLQTRETWQALAEHPHLPQPYLLCYFLGDDPTYWPRAAALAKEKGLSLLVIPVTEAAYRQPYPLADGLSPQGWLGHLDEAAFICTDSFHGTVFASMLQRPFAVFRRDREDDPASKNSRIDNLLRQLGLTDGLEDIPWPQVEERFAAMRQRGLSWLEASLSQALTPAAPQAPASEGSTGAAAPQ